MKFYLVFGLGITGISALKTLKAMNISAVGFDKNETKMLEIESAGFRTMDFQQIRHRKKDIYGIIKSPGIRPDHPFLQWAKQENIDILSDLEAADRLFPDLKKIAVTGTNGKTTVSSLIYHILSDAGIPCRLMGNIGIGMLWEMYQMESREIAVIEASSFQLHNVIEFSPDVAAMINIEEDHLDWHKSFKAYVDDKFKIFSRQTENDYAVINIDDPIIQKRRKEIEADIISVSMVNKRADVYYQDGFIFYKGSKLLNVEELQLKGLHNIQNTLIAIGVAGVYLDDTELIADSLKTFHPIAHRMEFVRMLNGVKYYNDSKGTNPASTIKAIESVKSPILIAGGYDKKIDLQPFFDKTSDKIKGLIAIGQTADIFAKYGEEYGISYVCKADNIEDAVQKATEIAENGDTVLLSPASASWGMYKNFEQRGNHFKQIVNRLG